MPEPIYVFINFAAAFTGLLSFAMLIRWLFSTIFESDGLLIRFADALTEPIILPFRKLFDRFNLFQETPFDMAFFLAYLSLSVLRMFLDLTLI